jgi:glycine/D-amino acid oxidase-like deaminating enzyme
MTPDFKETPYWWEAAPRRRFPERALPASVDVAVVGSGYTGLSAALDLARAGRAVAVFDEDDLGFGASSRNAGFVGRTLKHGLGELVERHGTTHAVAIYRELQSAFDHVLGVVRDERIDCTLVHCGRLQGALVPAHYESMAKDAELKRKHLGEEAHLLGGPEMRDEIGSDLYCGGRVIPDHAGLHPGLYHQGLLDRVSSAGAALHAHTRVLGIERRSDGFDVATARGRLKARDVLVATNGYTGRATPWLARRVVPFHGFMAATEPLAPARMARILPKRRLFHDYNNNLGYMRPSPDGTRMLLGGLTGGPAADLRAKARKLHARFARMIPDLAGAGLSHAWSGQCAASFDLYPHVGVADGVHYALGYCFAGLPMGTWLGHKAAQRILGSRAAPSLFDGRDFPTKFFYWGRPWFVPLYMARYDWLDRRGR